MKQITEGGYTEQKVTGRLGITKKSLFDWRAKFGKSSTEYQFERAAQDEVKKPTDTWVREYNGELLDSVEEMTPIEYLNKYGPVGNSNWMQD